MRKFNIDVAKPVCHITAPPDGHIIGGTQYTIRGTATDGGNPGCISTVTKVEIKFKKDDGDWGDWQACVGSGNDYSSWTYGWTGYTTGTYTFVARATDGAENVGDESVERSVTVNLEPPSVQTAIATPDPAKGGTVTISIKFKVNVSDGMNNSIPPDVKFVTAGDSEAITVAQSSYVGADWTGTAEISDTAANGEASIKVSGATDNNGGVMEPNNNAGSFVIDTIAPTVSDVTVVPDPAKAGNINVTVKFVEATSGLNTSVNPSVTFTPAGAGSATTVTLSGYDDNTKTWTGWATVAADMADGDAVIKVSGAKDKAGNEIEPHEETFVIDTTPPTDFELQSPEHDSWAKSDGLTFTWAASSDATSGLAKYQLYINDNVNQDDIPPDQTSIGPASTLLEAAYLWKVVAVDVAGNTKESTSTFKVKVDSTAPKTTLEIGEPKFSSGGITYVHPNTPFTLSADDGTGSGVDVTEYKIDSTNWTTYSDTFTVPTEGEHTVSYRSKDKVGNVETKKSVNIFVDNQPPGEFDLVSPDNDVWLTTAKPTLTWGESNDGGSGVDRYEIWIDGNLNSSVSGTSATPSDDLDCGEHEWTVIAYDNVGNSHNASSTRTFKIDVDKPVCEITAPPDGHTIGGTQYTISVTAADVGEADCMSGVAKVEIRFKKDGGNWGDWQDCTLGNSWSYVWTGYEEGAYTFVARATDVAGNVGNPSAPRSVTVNLEPPSVQTATATPDPAKAGTVTIDIKFRVNISDGMNNTIPPDVKFVTAGGSETIDVGQSSYVGANWTGEAEIKDTMANGEATIKVSGATDNNGGVMAPNNNAGSFVIDTVAPTVSDVTVVPDPAKPGTITVSVIFTEATSGLNVNVSPSVTFTPAGAATPIPVTQSEYGKATRTWTGTATITDDMPNGEAIVGVSGAEDLAGNVMQPNDLAGTFIIDTIKIGDVSGDGVITPRDASLIMQHVVGSINLLEAPVNVPLSKIDVTGDGAISALDAALIMRYIAGLIDKFPRALMGRNM